MCASVHEMCDMCVKCVQTLSNLNKMIKKQEDMLEITALVFPAIAVAKIHVSALHIFVHCLVLFLISFTITRVQRAAIYIFPSNQI